MTMRLRMRVPTGNPNEIETTTRLACQRHCHAPLAVGAPALTVAFRCVSFRVTFTSTIQQTIGKCGHKAMTVCDCSDCCCHSVSPPCLPSHIPLCLAVLPNAQSGNGCGCGNTCMRVVAVAVAAVATGSCCCCCCYDWRLATLSRQRQR